MTASTSKLDNGDEDALQMTRSPRWSAMGPVQGAPSEPDPTKATPDQAHAQNPSDEPWESIAAALRVPSTEIREHLARAILSKFHEYVDLNAAEGPATPAHRATAGIAEPDGTRQQTKPAVPSTLTNSLNRTARGSTGRLSPSETDVRAANVGLLAPQDQKPPVGWIASNTPPTQGVGAWPNIPHFFSSRQAIQVLSGTSSGVRHPPPHDKVVYLPTFEWRCYLTCNAATTVELDMFLPLIQYSVQDEWHILPDPLVLARMRGLEESGLATGTLPIVHDGRPVKQELPWLQSGAALRTAESFKDIPCQDGSHAGPDSSPKDVPPSGDDDNEYWQNIPQTHARGPAPCRPCGKSRRAALQQIGLMYISVMHTTQGMSDFGIPPPPPPPPMHGVAQRCHVTRGKPIYKVVRCGSRDAAAAKAFYEAGANGYSTVFTCAVRADIDWSVVAEAGLKRVNAPWELVDDNDGPVPIFF